MYALALFLLKAPLSRKHAQSVFLIFEPYLLSLSLMGEEWGEIMMGFLVLIFFILIYFINFNLTLFGFNSLILILGFNSVSLWKCLSKIHMNTSVMLTLQLF